MESSVCDEWGTTSALLVDDFFQRPSSGLFERSSTGSPMGPEASPEGGGAKPPVRPLLLLALSFPLLFWGWTCHGGSHHGSGCHTHDGLHHCHSHSGSHIHSGGVTILITDEAAKELRCFYLTVTEAVLLGEDVEPQTIYQSSTGWRCDLLSLRSGETRFYEALVSQVDVPIGVYHAIRLQVKDPRIVLRSGEVVEDVDLIAGGNVEIELPEALRLLPDQRVFFLLDIDVERSLLRPRSESHRWRLRPLVLVDTLRDGLREAVEAPSDVRGRFSESTGETGVHQLLLEDGRGVVPLKIDKETLVFDSDGDLVDGDVTLSGREATARGRFDDHGQLEAWAILLGETSTLSGVLLEGPEPLTYGETNLTLDLADPDGRERELEVRVHDATIISVDRAVSFDLDDFDVGDSITVTMPRSSDTDAPFPFAVLLDTRSRPDKEGAPDSSEASAPDRIAGVLSYADPRARIVVVASAEGRRTIYLPPQANLLFFEQFADSLYQGAMGFHDLEVGMNVEVEFERRSERELWGDFLVWTAE